MFSWCLVVCNRAYRASGTAMVSLLLTSTCFFLSTLIQYSIELHNFWGFDNPLHNIRANFCPLHNVSLYGSLLDRAISFMTVVFCSTIVFRSIMTRYITLFAGRSRYYCDEDRVRAGRSCNFHKNKCESLKINSARSGCWASCCCTVSGGFSQNTELKPVGV